MGQVILFSQEQEVRTWAEDNLIEPMDRMQVQEVEAIRT